MFCASTALAHGAVAMIRFRTILAARLRLEQKLLPYPSVCERMRGLPLVLLAAFDGVDDVTAAGGAGRFGYQS